MSKTIATKSVSSMSVSSGQRLTPHFYLASNGPALCLQNRGVGYPPGPQYTVYQAMRFQEDVIIEGLSVIGIKTQEDFLKAREGLGLSSSSLSRPSRYLDTTVYSSLIHKDEQFMPAGSLLLHEVEKPLDDEDSYVGITPYEQKLTNLQRIECDVKNKTVKHNVDGRSVSSTHLEQVQSLIVDFFSEKLQRRAQRRDIKLCCNLGIVK